MAEDYRTKSFWLRHSGDYKESPPLAGDLKCDVVIVGGGFCGIATAYYLKKREPSLNVAVLESEVVGFGASGRNAGFAMTTFGLMMSITKALFGAEKTRQSHQYMERAVDLVGELVAEHKLDCDYERTGFLRAATTPAYIKRIQNEVKLVKSLGLEGVDWLDAHATRARVNSELYLGAWWEPRCALVNPAKLAREMKRVVTKLGAEVYERTPVSEIKRNAKAFKVKTPQGTVTADKLVLATNAYSLQIPQLRRKQMPVWTYIVLTEPLSPERLKPIGWKGREGVEDYRNLVHYYRLTPDNRLLMGGRDVNLSYGDNMDKDYNERIFAELERDIIELFPSLKGIKIVDKWGGPVSVPLDMVPALGYLGDKRAVYSLGCMGHGVSLAHLNGEVLADLLLENKTQWTECFPVGRSTFPWPPEPIRYVVSQAILGYLHAEDAWLERKGLGTPKV
ncbi:MAG: FAD-dependent oxidoreductase [Chloroflexi bacterium]|nr:FAD-dependent oxidoreductase [Chloroflexota bacterium]MBM4454244.1 FAD-dependent oxidoreductase [Chloroflexota bacterium]